MIGQALQRSAIFRPTTFGLTMSGVDSDRVTSLHRDTAVNNLRFFNIFYGFRASTFALAVNLLDRILGKVKVCWILANDFQCIALEIKVCTKWIFCWTSDSSQIFVLHCYLLLPHSSSDSGRARVHSQSYWASQTKSVRRNWGRSSTNGKPDRRETAMGTGCYNATNLSAIFLWDVCIKRRSGRSVRAQLPHCKVTSPHVPISILLLSGKFSYNTFSSSCLILSILQNNEWKL